MAAGQRRQQRLELHNSTPSPQARVLLANCIYTQVHFHWSIMFFFFFELNWNKRVLGVGEGGATRASAPEAEADVYQPRITAEIPKER